MHQRLVQHRVNLRYLAFALRARDFEESPFSFLQEVVDIVGLVERLSLNGRGKSDEAASQIFLRHNASVKLHICRRENPRGEVGDVHGPSHLLQRAQTSQLLGNSNHVNWLLRQSQLGDGLIDFLMRRFVETVGHQKVADLHVGVLLEHHSAEYRRFEVGVARRQLAGG